jgi:hypothetical protein
LTISSDTDAQTLVRPWQTRHMGTTMENGVPSREMQRINNQQESKSCEIPI